VSDATRDIFLEVAYFDPTSVRRTRRALQLSTDASYRYERGIDHGNIPAALARAAQLLIAVAGGAIDGAPIDLYPAPIATPTIPLSTAKVAQLLGESIPGAEIAQLFHSVGFSAIQSSIGFSAVTVPSWRPDVTQPVDLVEEIARLRGYDSFSNELRPFRNGTVPDSQLAVQMRRVRETCVRAGLLEALSMPFVKAGGAPHVRVANPLADDEAYLRRDLLETLARRAEYNLAQRHRDVRLFEIGSVFEPSASGLPREEMRVAAIIMGHRNPPHWSEETTPDVDEWDAKGLAELMAASVEGQATTELHPASGDVLWEIRSGGEWLGHVRRLALDAPVWASPAFGVELRLATISSEPIALPGTGNHARTHPASATPPLSFRPFPSTPSTFFDVALLVPNDMPVSRVESSIRSASGDLLESLTLLSEFRGAGIAEGIRSVAWRLTFRHPERTLREKEVAGRRDKMLKTLEAELGVRQRTT
jgi:phenylalanyl-tRNA synthetase beta chain